MRRLGVKSIALLVFLKFKKAQAHRGQDDVQSTRPSSTFTLKITDPTNPAGQGIRDTRLNLFAVCFC